MIDQILERLQKVAETLPQVGLILVAIAISTVLLFIILRLLERRRILRSKALLLEITPPANSDRTPEATQRLFTVLHGLESSRTLADRLLQRRPTFSLEIASSKREGIRYIVRVSEADAPTFEQSIVSYVPDVKLQRVDDYMPLAVNHRQFRVFQFKQTGHFSYPLQTQLSLESHDPMAYLAGTMTKLSPDELMAFQLVVSPVKVREAHSIASQMIHNEALVYKLGKRKMPVGKLFSGLNAFLYGILDTIGETAAPTRTSSPHQGEMRHKQEVATKNKPARTLSVLEQELATSVNRKLQQPLFSVDIRALILVNNKQDIKQRSSAIRNALDSFKVPKYQSLRARTIWPKQLERYRLFTFTKRLPSLLRSKVCLLSAAEVADLYHFPHNRTAKTEDVVKSLSKTLPAPLAVKNGKFDVILGRNNYHNAMTDIGLTTAERERHVFIIGGTGNGKTTLLQYAIVQDIKSGKGVAVIDPHGDMAGLLLKYIPEERINDVIYFNPDDLAYPIGLNILELTPGLEGDDLLREKDLVTESVVSIFRKIFSEDDSGGHRIEYVLRNAVQTALTVKDATLFTIYRLLNDPKYRKKIVATLEDEDLKNFWKNELGRAGGMQQVKMMAGITSKIGRFLFSASAKRILEQPKSTINFDEILNGKILICNLSKGLLGEDTSELFGIAILAKIELAALRRARIKQSERKPFYLYVDEFQNFATPSFVQMLSEARKYKLYLTMAEQSTSQQDDQKMIDVILANVGTVICFRSGNPSDERLILPLFKPFIEEGEISNLPSYNFYIRIAAVKMQEPFSGETVLMQHESSEEVAREVIEISRKKNAIFYKSLAQEVSIQTMRKGKRVVGLPD